MKVFARQLLGATDADDDEARSCCGFKFGGLVIKYFLINWPRIDVDERLVIGLLIKAWWDLISLSTGPD